MVGSGKPLVLGLTARRDGNLLSTTMEPTQIMTMQLELIDPITPTVTTLVDILPGNCARMRHSGKILRKVKITGFLLNSTIVADVLNRGDCFVLDMAKGTLYAVSNSLECTAVSGKFQYSIKQLED